MEEREIESTQNQGKRFTYEQLEQIAANLSTQVQSLSSRLQEANMFNAFKKLDYCFKVLELSNTTQLLSFDFVQRCASEIEEMMSPSSTEQVTTEGEIG